MQFTHNNKGTCSRAIEFEVEGNVVKNVRYIGGCHGNTQGIAALVEGMNVDDAIARMKGIRCGMKETSCPDQLARALEAAKAEMAK